MVVILWDNIEEINMMSRLLYLCTLKLGNDIEAINFAHQLARDLQKTTELNNAIMSNGVQGWLSPIEGELLYNLAARCSAGYIVEIGSWHGKSTIYLAKGSKSGSNVKVMAVDTHKGSKEHQEQGSVWTYPTFMENVTKFGVVDIIIPYIGTSEAAAKAYDIPVELIFIDGSHEYEDIRKDFDLWSKKIVKRGIIAFHDSKEWDSVKRVIDECLTKENGYNIIGTIESITFAEKIALS